MELKQSKKDMAIYKVGERDQRPWGHYVVTAVGDDFCEKEITVNPGQVLSLQSHEMRRETWTVVKGVLTVLIDGERSEVAAGKSVYIPEKAIHCMAALGDEPCTVKERQEGICREEDIKRYIDAYGRGTETARSPEAVKSIEAYNQILAEIKEAQQ